MSPWNRTKNILHRDWLLNSHSETRGRPNAIKGGYFESISSFIWFDQKTKYLVPIIYISIIKLNLARKVEFLSGD